MIFPADLVELVGARIARADPLELSRIEKAIAHVHAGDAELLAAVAPSIDARRRGLHRGRSRRRLAVRPIMTLADLKAVVPALERDVAVMQGSLQDMGTALERIADSLNMVVEQLACERKKRQ